MTDRAWHELLAAARRNPRIDPELVERGEAMLSGAIDHIAWWAYCATLAHEQGDLGALDYMPRRSRGAMEGEGTYAARVADWHATLDGRLVTLRTWEAALRLIGDGDSEARRDVCRTIERYVANAYELTPTGRAELRVRGEILRRDRDARIARGDRGASGGGEDAPVWRDDGARGEARGVI